MSSTLYWRLPPRTRKEHALPDHLKYLFTTKLFEGNTSAVVTVDKRLIDYLDGIIDTNDPASDFCKSVSKLKSAIEEYGEIELLIYS